MPTQRPNSIIVIEVIAGVLVCIIMLLVAIMGIHSTMHNPPEVQEIQD